MPRDPKFDPATYTTDYCAAILRECPGGALRLALLAHEVPIHRIYNHQKTKRKPVTAEKLRKSA